MSGGVLDHFCYRCIGKHKRGTFDEGPPRYQPAGTKCPDDLIQSDILRLLASSVSEDGSPRAASRFALRRQEGRLEFFETKLSGGTWEGGRRVLHGHPVTPGEVPVNVLRAWWKAGHILAAEYRSSIKGKV